MKTITGTVNSSKPVSLSKASSILKNFISKETGASQAVTAFLTRSSDSFTELVQFHKELKSKRSERKQKRSDLYENGEEGSEKKRKKRKERDESEEDVKSKEEEEEGYNRKKKKRRHVKEE